MTSPTDGSMTARIRAKLDAAFAPERLEVVDESDEHRGHGGWREGGETHFHVAIRATAFAGLSRVAQHRAVNDALREELDGGVHALRLSIEASET